MANAQENDANQATTAQEYLTREATGSCANPGNPVFSCLGKAELSETTLPRDQHFKPHHPLYQTSSSAYGEMHATFATVPSTHHPKEMKFTQHLGTCGMFRNHSLNTAMDRSKVYDPPRM